MNDEQDDKTNPRRAFIRNAAAAAIGAGVLAVAGEAKAKGKGDGKCPSLKGKNKFAFSANLAPGALSNANIEKISHSIAQALAAEAKIGVEKAPMGFHIRIGGGHSRVFSKTADHKNVGHSEVIIEGSGP